MSGSSARRDCLTEASATRRHRSGRAPRSNAPTVVSVARADDRLDGGDAQHDRIAHDVIHLLALEHRLHERDGDRRLHRRVDAGQQLQGDVASRRGDDACKELVPAAVEHAHRIADANPQDACQMLRLIAGQHDDVVAWIESRRKEAMHGRVIIGGSGSRTDDDRFGR